MTSIFFYDSITMLKLGKIGLKKEDLYIKVCDVNVDNIVVWELIKTQKRPKYLIGYLDDFIRPWLFILPKMSGFVRTFKDKEDKISGSIKTYK